MLAQLDRLHLCVALVAQSPILVAYEATIGQLLVAQLAIEAAWMPAGRHRLDHTTNHKITAFIAARSEQHLEIAFAVFASFELVENAVRETAEALGTPGTRRLWWVSIGVMNDIVRRIILTQNIGYAKVRRSN